ncbi:DNA topoisomerase III [Propionispora hippei]|uniref:DNA topoisomerase 3 n=1 Tax=Propionispora hippei DSM 15287 TaxID=1123003 RepID=A0A1M6IM13_9FIRM|nr:DNA topoisomerase III [Propionispora hippei]SHJ35405.1 DNA topoisomerase-3 [Propionispora hippei DSM 15287]
MSKILVLAEKPSVGRDIAKVLACHKQGNGYWEGERHVITWALGHLVTLADPEEYDEKYKSWRLEDLPMLPATAKLVVIRQSSRQFRIVKEQLLRKDVGEVVIATDAGREGELVARWILEKAGSRKPVKRLWISSVTDKAIRAGFSSLKPGKAYESLYAAAAARAEADWLVGINATRALTCKYNAQLSCGRVQTPTLAMIAAREAEISRFKPRPYYGLAAVAGGVRLIWRDGKTNEPRTFQKEVRDNLLAGLANKTMKIIEVVKQAKKAYAPGLYDLTELQRDANKAFGYSAKETLSIAQRLYESHKVLTYPRTDSRYLSSDIVETLKERLEACGVGPYTKAAFAVLKRPIRANSHFVDDGKVSDHHAIIPTEQFVSLQDFSEQERKIYDLVIKRFLAVLYPPFEYEQIAVKALLNGEIFTARGKVIQAAGWKELYGGQWEGEEDADDEQEQVLPQLAAGAVLPVGRLIPTEGETKPPARFTEATLLSAMENPVAYMKQESDSLKKTIGETGGLGTVATRADIIEKLFNSFLLEKKGKDIHLTSKGKQLLELVPDDLKSPALTAQWEQKLGAIAKGALSKTDFVQEMKRYAGLIVGRIKDSQESFTHDNMTRSKCPECGKYLLEVNGKRGKMLVCQDRDCGYRKGLSQTTNARCPNCHKKLELRGEKENRLFVCTCGYREKLTAFQERKNKEQDKSSKREVAVYLKEQKKIAQEPLNTALADALAKLRLKD